jgi:hypothetical protein
MQTINIQIIFLLSYYVNILCIVQNTNIQTQKSENPVLFKQYIDLRG